MYTNQEFSSELEHTLAKIKRVNFVVDCWPCPFFSEYTLADDSFEVTSQINCRLIYLKFNLFCIALSDSIIDKEISLN